MAEIANGDYEAGVIASELKQQKNNSKDAKNKHKVEARRRIDDLMEKKRLRELLDLEADDVLEVDYLN